MSYCGQLGEFSSNHSHLPIITVILGMLLIPLYLLLVQLFSTALLLRQKCINKSSGDEILNWCTLFSFHLVVYWCLKCVTLNLDGLQRYEISSRIIDIFIEFTLGQLKCSELLLLLFTVFFYLWGETILCLELWLNISGTCANM